jgi:hypothetical protein
VRASALQSKINQDGIASDGGLSWLNGHWASQKSRPRRYRQITAANGP